MADSTGSSSSSRRNNHHLRKNNNSSGNSKSKSVSFASQLFALDYNCIDDNDHLGLAQVNLARWAEILECQDKIRYYQNKLNKLRKEHQRAQLLTAVAHSPSTAWPRLAKNLKFQKDVVLAALSSKSNNNNNNLPHELCEPAWQRGQGGKIPQRLRQDKEIFLARLRRSDFREYYSISGDGDSNKHNSMLLPLQFLCDKDLMIQVIQYCPALILILSREQRQSEDHDDDDTTITTMQHQQCREEQRQQLELLFDDDDVLIALLEHHADRAAEFLPLLSTRLLSSPALMRQTIVAISNSHHDTNKKKSPGGNRISCSNSSSSRSPVLTATVLRVSKTLRNNKAWCLEVAEQVLQLHGPTSSTSSSSSSCPLLLRDLSQRLRNDMDVVLAFCKVSGRNLSAAGYPLRRNLLVARTACQQNPCALLYVLKRSKAFSTLVNDKEFVLHTIFGGGGGENKKQKPALVDESDYRRLFHLLPKSLKNDVDVTVQASIISHAVLMDIRKAWKDNLQFWSRVVVAQNDDLLCWTSCTDELFNNVEFVLTYARHIRWDFDIGLALIMQGNNQDRNHYQRMSQTVLSDRGVIRNLVKNLPVSSWHHYLTTTPAPSTTLLADKAFCLELLQLDGRVYEYVAPNLYDDRDIVEAALANHHCQQGNKKNDDDVDACKYYPHDVLRFLPHSVQHLYPDLIAQTILACQPAHLLDHVLEVVCEGLWSNREVALAWVSAGGCYLEGYFPQELEEDQEIFLAIAEHNPDDFDYVSENLSEDKEFMIQVVQKNAYLIDDVDEDLEDDFDIMLAAFATDSGLIPYIESMRGDDGSRQIALFAGSVRQRLQSHLAFMTVLGVISLVKETATCPLALLNQGKETSLAYKQLIADCIGLPTADELEKLRRVSVDLTRWGY